MSVTTKTGDAGTTGLMYNRRVSKCHPRVEACGGIDELNSALGLARALTDREFVREPLLAIQQDLIVLMGELATLPEDAGRYEQDGYSRVTSDLTARLDRLGQTLEAENVAGPGWAMPGANPASAALDVARTVCRRAERRVCALHETKQLANAKILIYLNRLSDVLWLAARWLDAQSHPRIE